MKIPLRLNSVLNRLQKRSMGAKWLVIGIWLSCLAVCCGYLWRAENIYSGTVKLQVFRDPQTHIGSVTSRNGESFIARELALLVSGEALLPVVQEAKLANRWRLNTDQEAIQRLAKMVTSSEARGTDLIIISVRSSDRNESAELANAIALSYQESRNSVASNSDREAYDLIQQGLDQEEADLAECSQNFIMAMRAAYHPVDLEMTMALADKWLIFCETLSEEEVKQLLPVGMLVDGCFRPFGHEELLPIACDHLIGNPSLAQAIAALPEKSLRDGFESAKTAAKSPDLILAYVELQTALGQVDAEGKSALGVDHSVSSARHNYLISKAAYQRQAGRVYQMHKDILGQVVTLDGSLPPPVQIHENAYPSPIPVFPRLKDFVGLLTLANVLGLGLGVGCAVLVGPKQTK